jgi:iron(III) transport system substrate-binding protein
MAQALEDRLVVYSAAEKQHCASLLAGFAACCPGVAVDFRDGISVELDQRYRTSLVRGAPDADVIWSSAMDLQLALVAEGHARPIASRHAAALPRWGVFGDLAYATTVEPLVTLVDRRVVDPSRPAGSIGEIARLIGAEPQVFRGRVACYDIERNGLGFLALLHAARAEDDFECFLRVISACAPAPFASNPTLVEALASGRAVIAYHVLASYALRAIGAHPELAIAATREPMLAVSRVAIACKTAPHPRAAERFIDWLLSDDAQQSLGEAGLFPIRSTPAEASGNAGADSMQNHAVRPAVGLEPIAIDDAMARLREPARRDALLRRWRQAVPPATAPRSPHAPKGGNR